MRTQNAFRQDKMADKNERYSMVVILNINTEHEF